MSEVRNYYLYMFFDTRYFGPFKYQDLVFELMPRYVGISVNPRTRKNRHLSECYANTEENKIKGQVFRGIKQDTNENPKFEILFSDLTKKEAKQLEIQYIEKIGRIINNSGPLANVTLGGESGHGLIPWNKGLTKDNNETLKKVSERVSIWNKSSDKWDGSNNPNFGKDFTGMNNPSHKFEYHIQDPQGNYHYTLNLSEFSKYHKLKTTNLRRAVSGDRRTFKGWVGFQREYDKSSSLSKEEIDSKLRELLINKSKKYQQSGKFNYASKYSYLLFKEGFFLYDGYSLSEMCELFNLKKTTMLKTVKGNSFRGYQLFKEAYKVINEQ